MNEHENEMEPGVPPPPPQTHGVAIEEPNSDGISIYVDVWDGIIGMPPPEYALVTHEIQKVGPQLIDFFEGTQLLAASTVVSGLQALKIQCPAPLNPNRVTHCLGSQLRIPYITRRGRKRYAIHLVNASPEDKSAYQVTLDELTPEELKMLKVA